MPVIAPARRRATVPPPFASAPPLLAHDHADDFLARLRALLLEHAPELAAVPLEAVLAAIQAEWGGDRPYIRKQGEAARVERSLRDRAIVRDHQRGESAALLARRYGISRRRVEQLVRNALP